MTKRPGGAIPLLDLGERSTRPVWMGTYLICATILPVGIGLLMGQYLLAPLQAIAIFPLFFSLLSRGRWSATLLTMILWAVLTATLVACLSLSYGEWMSDRILMGEPYRVEMFHWVQTGEGRESNPGLFIPQHLFHFLVFALVTFLSGGFLGLAMGAVLTNYMAYYVGQLVSHSVDASTVIWMAWPPWAIIRVIAFIMVAIALSAVAYERFGVSHARLDNVRRFLAVGLALLLLDVALKWSLAPFWQAVLSESTNLRLQ